MAQQTHFAVFVVSQCFDSQYVSAGQCLHVLVGSPSGPRCLSLHPVFLHAGSYMSWQRSRGERPVIFTPAVSWFLSLASAVTFTTLLPGGRLEYHEFFLSFSTPCFFSSWCLRMTVNVYYVHIFALQFKSE